MTDVETATSVEVSELDRCRWKAVVAVLAAVVWMVGTVIRLTVRDAVPLTSPIFYALPVPVLLIAGWIPTRGLWRIGRRRLAMLAAAILVCQACFWAGNAFRRQTDFRKDSLRFLFWNVCRGNLGYDAILSRIGSEHPDIVAVAEATREGQDAEFWESRLPDFSATCLGGGMVLLTNTRNNPVIENIKKGQVPDQLRYRLISLRINDRPVSVLIADIKSAPLNFRRPAFEHLAELLEPLDDRPLILAGDFNTPVDSVHVNLLRDRMTNAFEVSGAGYRETWPVVFPVLSLDQIWGNDRVQWHRCWSAASSRSDHRMMIGEFSVR